MGKSDRSDFKYRVKTSRATYFYCSFDYDDMMMIYIGGDAFSLIRAAGFYARWMEAGPDPLWQPLPVPSPLAAVAAGPGEAPPPGSVGKMNKGHFIIVLMMSSKQG